MACGDHLEASQERTPSIFCALDQELSPEQSGAYSRGRGDSIENTKRWTPSRIATLCPPVQHLSDGFYHLVEFAFESQGFADDLSTFMELEHEESGEH